MSHLPLAEETGDGIFGENIHYRRCGGIENRNGRFFYIRQASPRSDAPGVLLNAFTLIDGSVHPKISARQRGHEQYHPSGSIG
jgi:hypothetical protein